MAKQGDNCASTSQIGDVLLTRTQELKDFGDDILNGLNSLRDLLKNCDHDMAQLSKDLQQLEKVIMGTLHELEVETHDKSQACNKIHEIKQECEETGQTLRVSEQTLQHSNDLLVCVKANVQRLENEQKIREQELQKDIFVRNQEIQDLQRSDEHAQDLFEKEMDKINREMVVLKVQINSDLERGASLSKQNRDAHIQYNNLENVLKDNDELNSKAQANIDNLSHEIKHILDKKAELENRLQNKILEEANMDTEELVINQLIRQIEQDILDKDIQNDHLNNHEIYQSLAQGCEEYEAKKEHFEKNICSTQHSLTKSIENQQNISKEIENMNGQNEILQTKSNNLKNEIRNVREVNVKIKTLIEEANSAVELLTKESGVVTLDLVKLRLDVQELVSKISTMQPVDVMDADTIYEEINKIKKTTDDKGDEYIYKKKQYFDEVQNVIDAEEKETVDKIAQLEEKMSEIKNTIIQLLDEKKTTELEFQGKLLECDVFTRKRKDAEAERTRLVTMLEQSNAPPAVPKEVRKRQVANDDDFDSDASSYTALTSIEERRNYKRNKRAASQLRVNQPDHQQVKRK